MRDYRLSPDIREEIARLLRLSGADAEKVEKALDKLEKALFG